jgi:hypothetical protein
MIGACLTLEKHPGFPGGLVVWRAPDRCGVRLFLVRVAGRTASMLPRSHDSILGSARLLNVKLAD